MPIEKHGPHRRSPGACLSIYLGLKVNQLSVFVAMLHPTSSMAGRLSLLGDAMLRPTGILTQYRTQEHSRERFSIFRSVPYPIWQLKKARHLVGDEKGCLLYALYVAVVPKPRGQTNPANVGRATSRAATFRNTGLYCSTEGNIARGTGPVRPRFGDRWKQVFRASRGSARNQKLNFAPMNGPEKSTSASVSESFKSCHSRCL